MTHIDIRKLDTPSGQVTACKIVADTEGQVQAEISRIMFEAADHGGYAEFRNPRWVDSHWQSTGYVMP